MSPKKQINCWDGLTFLNKHLMFLRSLKEPFGGNSVKISDCRAFSCLFETVPGCRAFSHSVTLIFLFFFFFCFMQMIVIFRLGDLKHVRLLINNVLSKRLRQNFKSTKQDSRRHTWFLPSTGLSIYLQFFQFTYNFHFPK